MYVCILIAWNPTCFDLVERCLPYVYVRSSVQPPVSLTIYMVYCGETTVRLTIYMVYCGEHPVSLTIFMVYCIVSIQLVDYLYGLLW